MSFPLIEPHGGILVDRFVPEPEAGALRSRAQKLPRILLDSREQADLELIATGAASPLRGFLGSNDYRTVLAEMRLSNGTVWPLPLTLAIDGLLRPALEKSGEAALVDARGRLWGSLRVSDIFERDPLSEARAIYGTESPSHPGVAYLLSRPRWLVGGEVQVLPLPDDLPFASRRLTPRKLRGEIQARGWRRIAGFQTRNPIHRAHEHLTKVALETVDGLVLHPLVGETKDDDVPASVRFKAYEILLEKYYPKDRTLLAAFPAAMRYAGPREAVFHAVVRKNYGITHLIVGRDHAGVGRFYGPFDAHHLFDAFQPSEIGVVPIKFDAAFFCRSCGSLASTRTCPHEGSHRLELSGSKVREILRSGGSLPAEFTRPEIADVLRAHYATGNGSAQPSLIEQTPALAEVAAAPARERNADAVEALLASQILASLPQDLRTRSQGFNEVAAGRFMYLDALSQQRAQRGRGFILWFTGLSGAGKSTLAHAVRSRLGLPRLQILDGDEVRTYLSKGLGFSKEDRDTNVRRIGYVARLLARNGVPVIAAAISPYADARAEVRSLAAEEDIPFIEAHVHAELSVLVQRDVKGLYRKALAGEIANFTGISDPYEVPHQPDILVRTDRESVEESVARIAAAIDERGSFNSREERR